MFMFKLLRLELQILHQRYSKLVINLERRSIPFQSAQIDKMSHENYANSPIPLPKAVKGVDINPDI